MATHVCSGAPQINCSGETEQYAFWVLRQGQQIHEACWGPCAILGYDEFNRLTSSGILRVANSPLATPMTNTATGGHRM